MLVSPVRTVAGFQCHPPPRSIWNMHYLMGQNPRQSSFLSVKLRLGTGYHWQLCFIYMICCLPKIFLYPLWVQVMVASALKGTTRGTTGLDDVSWDHSEIRPDHYIQSWHMCLSNGNSSKVLKQCDPGKERWVWWHVTQLQRPLAWHRRDNKIC